MDRTPRSVDRSQPAHAPLAQPAAGSRPRERTRYAEIIAVAMLALAFAAPATAAADAMDAPSRKASKGCKWEKMTDAKLGLDLWAQRCDYGDRKIDFLFTGSSLAQRYSDGGAPEPVIDVYDLEAGDTPEAGVKRVFAAHADKAVAARCVIAPYKEGKAPAGAERFTFVPDRAYAKELKKKQDPNDVPEPPCGDFGDAPDGIQYFETQPKSGAAKILFVRVGQDEPLFDERTLRLLPPAPTSTP